MVLKGIYFKSFVKKECKMMTKKIFTVCCLIGFFHSFCFAKQSYDDFLSDFKEPDCKQIMDFVNETLELSTSNQALMVMAVDRFSKAIKQHSELEESELEEKQKTDKNLQHDLDKTLFYIGENESILFDRATTIKRVLPSCLSEKDKGTTESTNNNK